MFPPYLLVGVCGPPAAAAARRAAGRAAFPPRRRGLALSLCSSCTPTVQRRLRRRRRREEQTGRPLPSGARSRAQGLLVAAFYGCLGLGVTRTPLKPALRRAYAAPRRHGRRLSSPDDVRRRAASRGAPLGRALAFCIYAFDGNMYVEARDAWASPAPFAANPLFGAFSGPPPRGPLNLALLVAKDLGDVPGDAAAGSTAGRAAGRPERGAPVLAGTRRKYRGPSYLHAAIEQTRSRGQRRVDGVGRPKLWIYTG